MSDTIIEQDDYQDHYIGKTTDHRRDSALQPVGSLGDEYVYAPLKDPTQDIRLCNIAPSSATSELDVRIQSVRRTDRVGSYSCLSYAWGDPKCIPVAIALNDRMYRLGPNLHSLLRRLRALGIEGDVWIDALCINQKDVDEKAEQVKLMGQIYSGAQEVLIGLEEAGQDPEQSAHSADVKATIMSLAEGACLKELDAFHTDSGYAFRQLLKSAYFSRTWVVQEVCLSQKASILGSWGKIPWQTFVEAFQNWNYHRSNCCKSFAETFDEELIADCHRVYCAVRSLTYTTENVRKEREQHLLQLMLTYQHLAISDKRDKIFGLQGLHTARSELPTPDYNQPKEVVYTRMSAWMIEDTRSLMLLALDLHEDQNLSSWVPDFSAQPPYEPNYWRRRLTCYGTYDCSRGLDWSCRYEAPSTLCLSGIMVDHIQYVARPTLAFKGPTEHANLLKEWYAFAGGGITSLSGPDGLDNTFVETMLAGCIQDQTGIHKANATDLAKWKEILFQLIQDASLEQHQTSPEFMACHMTAVLNRALFRTATGLLGLGPKSLRSGDQVWVIAGSKSPIILAGQQGTSLSAEPMEPDYILVGDAYIHSIMDGSAVGPQSQVQPCNLI